MLESIDSALSSARETQKVGIRAPRKSSRRVMVSPRRNEGRGRCRVQMGSEEREMENLFAKDEALGPVLGWRLLERRIARSMRSWVVVGSGNIEPRRGVDGEVGAGGEVGERRLAWGKGLLRRVSTY